MAEIVYTGQQRQQPTSMLGGQSTVRSLKAALQEYDQSGRVHRTMLSEARQSRLQPACSSNENTAQASGSHVREKPRPQSSRSQQIATTSQPAAAAAATTRSTGIRPAPSPSSIANMSSLLQAHNLWHHNLHDYTHPGTSLSRPQQSSSHAVSSQGEAPARPQSARPQSARPQSARPQSGRLNQQHALAIDSDWWHPAASHVRQHQQHSDEDSAGARHTQHMDAASYTHGWRYHLKEDTSGVSDVFPSMGRAGFLSAPYSMTAGQACQTSLHQKPSLTAVRANVAATAAQLLRALSTGSSEDQLYRLGLIDRTANSTASTTSISRLGNQGNQQRVAALTVNGESAHTGREMLTVAAASREAKALHELEMEHVAEARLQRCAAWVANKVPEACCVCLDVMHLDESVVMLAACGHRMHQPCLKAVVLNAQEKVQKLVCPICRAQLESPSTATDMHSTAPA